MKILAFDTSTLSGSAAVIDDGVVLAESTARVRATHSEHLLPLIDEVLTRAGLSLDAIDRIAVGIGPGSFTGVRIAVATAKGLHLSSGVALVGVSSLDALLASAWSRSGHVLCTLDARRGEVYASLYFTSQSERRAVFGPVHEAPATLGARALSHCPEANIVVVGDLDVASLERLIACDPSRFTLAPGVAATPLARFIAWEALVGNGRVDLGDLEPLYVRGSDAKLPAPRGAST